MTIEARRTSSTPSNKRRTRRAVAAVLVGSLVCLLGVIGLAAPAQAEAYRYWTFWNGSGTSWEFAQKAPDGLIPADGSSDGWRFEIAGADATTSRPPRIAPDFAAVCATTPAEVGKKRVAVIIDFGLPAEAPAGSTPPAPIVHCVVAPPQANSQQVLAAVDAERMDKGLLCAVGGYPSTGCADTLANATAPPTAQATLPVPTPAASVATTGMGDAVSPAASTTSTFPWRTVIGVVIVLALVWFAVVRGRRGLRP